MNFFSKLLFFAAIISLTAISCKEEVKPTPSVETSYFLGIEAATSPATDVLTPASSLDSGIVTPIGFGIEQPAWMTFIQGEERILAGGYTSAPEFTSYTLENGQLTKGSSFFTDLTVYAFGWANADTIVMIGSPREGLSEKKIYLVNTQSMAIEQTVLSTFGNVDADSMFAFPVDIVVRENKMFVAYFHMHARGDFSTPMSDQAQLAVFSYPELQLEKIISDDRAPNIGRYYTTNALETDENGNIYSYSPSSLACGYAPVPSKNSAVLRVNNGETDFDPSYYIDFETLSGGYKINDMYYVANGKAVVRVLKEEETNPDYLWATYSPVGDNPLLKTGILDLENQTFTMLDEVPMAGGGWNSAVLIEDNLLYLGVSNSSYAGVYIIDVENGTATEGVKVDGNYAKGIMSLKKN